MWIGLGLVLGFAVISLDTDIYEVGAPLFYGAMMLLLMVTIVIAPDIKGSRSWLVLGPVRLQPAEFAKVATALTLAWLCNQYDFKIESIRSYLKIFAIHLLPHRSSSCSRRRVRRSSSSPSSLHSSAKASQGSSWGSVPQQQCTYRSNSYRQTTSRSLIAPCITTLLSMASSFSLPIH